MQINLLVFFLLCVSHIQAVELSGSSHALPLQTATVTTLPPAQPSSNDTNPCGFTDRTALLDRVVSDWQGYNISLLVDKCPDVCVLIFGDGNPDVSGIGVLVSYIVQFVSTVLVGPGLLYLLLLEGYFSDGLNQFLSMVIKDIMPAINSSNNWIMFSIIVASAIRISQYPPVFEMDFINTLIWFQWVMVLARVIVSGVLSYWRHEEKLIRSIVWSTLFTLLTLFVTSVMSLKVGYPAGAQSEALVAISRFCVLADDMPVPLVYVPSGKKPNFPFWQFALSVLLGPYIPAGVMIVVIIAGSILAIVGTLVFGLLRGIWDLFWAMMPKLLQKRLKVLGLWAFKALKCILILLPGAIWLAFCVWLITILQGARNDLQKALGQQYQDSYWGFGQVTIIVMLLPSIFDVLGKIISFRPVPKEPQAGTAEEYEPQPLLGVNLGKVCPIVDEHVPMQSSFPTASEGRNYETEPAGESSSRSSDTPGSIVSQNGGSKGGPRAEESFELTQRMKSFPKDAQGNILPLHSIR